MELLLEKEIGASSEECYKAFTEPALLSKWFTTNAKTELKPGGRYSNGDNDEGEFLELSPFKRIRFTWENKDHCPGTEVKIDFIPLNNNITKVMLTHSKLENDSHFKDMGTGWTWALESAKQFLEKGKPVTFSDWKKANLQ